MDNIRLKFSYFDWFWWLGLLALREWFWVLLGCLFSWAWVWCLLIFGLFWWFECVCLFEWGLVDLFVCLLLKMMFVVVYGTACCLQRLEFECVCRCLLIWIFVICFTLVVLHWRLLVLLFACRFCVLGLFVWCLDLLWLCVFGLFISVGCDLLFKVFSYLVVLGCRFSFCLWVVLCRLLCGEVGFTLCWLCWAYFDFVLFMLRVCAL